MALLEEQFTEKLEAGAPDITYKGNEGKEQQIARELWDQLPNQVRMQFGSFQQFFDSGAWKEVLAQLQQAQQAPEQMPPQPQEGVGAMMPAQMAYGGVAGPDGRRAYGLGSIFKKITRPIKKVLKSDVGKAALLGAGIYGLGGGFGGPGNWGVGKGFKLGNIGKTLFGAKPFKYGVPFTDAMQTSAGTSGILGKLKLTGGEGSMMPTALGWGAAASLAPFAMSAMGKWDTGEEEIDKLKLKAAEFDFDYNQMIQDLQTAVGTGSEAELAKVLSQYNLSRGDMPGSTYIGTAAEGGRIGYDMGGDVLPEAPMSREEMADRGYSNIYDEHGPMTYSELKKFITRRRHERMLKKLKGSAQGGRIGYDMGGNVEDTQREEIINRLVEMGISLEDALIMAQKLLGTPRRIGPFGPNVRAQSAKPTAMMEDVLDVITPSGRFDSSITIDDRLAKVFPSSLPKAMSMSGRMQRPEIGEMIMEKFRTPRMEESVEEIRESLPGMNEGGLMSLGGMEMDLRGGGFVPLGAQEKADDVPARLSKNEFVFTADAVRAAGGGDVDAGADKMYKTMKQLENRVG